MRVANLEQLLDTLDQLFDDGSDWTRRDAYDHWAQIFSRPDHPLNSDFPDVNLVDWSRSGLLPGGAGHSALDIGCGLGRNTRWFAGQGYRAVGIDISPFAVTGARERSADSDATYMECDVLREGIPGGPYDVVYDSGCFHHLAPHRRLSYFSALAACLKPGGRFGICTFAPGKMGSDGDDLTLLRQGSLEGGIAYGPEDLRALFSWLELLDSGPLRLPEQATEAVFSMEFLNAALFRRSAKA
ncbi:methyltransferase type 11 [Deinococcus malanensis]|uniref:Methyltransferase type 11 n=1 Tax=Deinococcus malanensis TaxID=1706855 RepID=A0ABQ2EXV5_9DEIO|nr:class I SAM-dependent methyltransferase [Deinococcus malanensis]GGK31617.1 methyltransferase type 11 [Deinococcus malanensis]